MVSHSQTFGKFKRSDFGRQTSLDRFGYIFYIKWSSLALKVWILDIRTSSVDQLNVQNTDNQSSLSKIQTCSDFGIPLYNILSWRIAASQLNFNNLNFLNFQELYESQYTLVDVRLEIDTLKEDNLRSLESLLRSEYPGYVPCSESEGEEEEEEDLDGEDDDDDANEIDSDSDQSQTSDQVNFA